MISVIVPVYNTEKYLKRCIDSVLSQSFTDYEIILIDDGSTDSSGQICDEYVEENIRISCIHNANGGLSRARNKGLEVARGEYIAFLDSDDYMHKHMLKILHDSIEKSKADIAMCGFKRVPENAPEEKLNLSAYSFKILKDRELIQELFGEKSTMMVVAWNKLYRREIFDEIKYPEKRLHEDEFVIHKILHRCSSMIVTEAPLYNYVVRAGAITSELTYKRVKDLQDALWDRLQFYKGLKDVTALKKTTELWLYCLFDNYEKSGKLDADDCKEIRKYLKGLLKEKLPVLEKVRLVSKEKATEYKLWLVNPLAAGAFKKMFN